MGILANESHTHKNEIACNKIGKVREELERFIRVENRSITE